MTLFFVQNFFEILSKKKKKNVFWRKQVSSLFVQLKYEQIQIGLRKSFLK